MDPIKRTLIPPSIDIDEFEKSKTVKNRPLQQRAKR